MAQATDHRQRTNGHGFGHTSAIESREIATRASATDHDHGIETALGAATFRLRHRAEQVEGPGQLALGGGPLDGRVHEEQNGSVSFGMMPKTPRPGISKRTDVESKAASVRENS